MSTATADYQSHEIVDMEGLNASQRAMIAARLVQKIKQEKEASRRLRRRETSRIRSLTPKGEQQSCAVCLGFRPITVRHHVNPVSKSDPDDSDALRTVWLCPNCHAIVHHFLSAGPYACEFADLLTPDQWNRVSMLNEVAR